MKHVQLDTAGNVRKTDEELLRGEWTEKGIDDYPPAEELSRMIRLLDQKELQGIIKRQNQR